MFRVDEARSSKSLSKHGPALTLIPGPAVWSTSNLTNPATLPTPMKWVPRELMFSVAVSLYVPFGTTQILPAAASGRGLGGAYCRPSRRRRASPIRENDRPGSYRW